MTGGIPVAKTRVVPSDDAGGFYCALLLFALCEEAHRSDTPIQRGPHGPLVGFLHVPDAPYDYTPIPGPADERDRFQASRHRVTREVVGLALRGLIAAMPPLVRQRPRVLLTGFGPFRDVRDNPTGDFVTHLANVEEAVRLIGPDAQYLRIERRVLPVSDAAIDPDHPDSVQRAIAELRPHAVLSMGVVADRRFGPSPYRVEVVANDRNLARDLRGWRYEAGLAARAAPYRTEALWEALRQATGT